jgi:hypothetical protein
MWFQTHQYLIFFVLVFAIYWAMPWKRPTRRMRWWLPMVI